ncbi:MAG: multi-sensor hybrid histidine kinase [Caulobacter sp.]|nr:multi-sensor hybrid histidine kinase [Caulobacter sp.]
MSDSVPKAEPLISEGLGDAEPRARILIVDDDERNAFAASQALESLGQELVVARSGEEALRKLLVDDYAVILLDLHMPGMDGYETAELIRRRRRNRDTPIVFLTAVFREESHIFKAYSAGAVDVVFKPVDPFILRSKVQVLVDLHLKTQEIERQSEHRRRLLEENALIHAEKLAAERALRRTEERQEAILRSLPIVFHSRTLEPPFAPLFLSAGVDALTGFTASHFIDEAGFGLSRIHPDDVAGVIDGLTSAAKLGGYSCEYRWLCADGVYRAFLDQGLVTPGAEGQTAEIIGAMMDVTDRRTLEQELGQARKMEAVGQLTGGVAHDFNNLLTVILGNVESIERRVTGDERVTRQLAAVRHAAERGGALTQQLLAFSRRQHLNPVTVELNGLIEAFSPLLRQAVSEAVTLVLDLAAEPLHVHLDAAQFEGALLNLAVNARDAMAGGGALTITTTRLAGSEDWIQVTVRDTGAGMDADTAARIFEPFFTTKDVGKGSGLGLSQVYGFVRQSGGEVSVDSKPGVGAVFDLRLPISSQSPVARSPFPTPVEAPRGTERLLVVEDDPAVLALTSDWLQELGYAVTTATNADAALRHLRGRKSFDLLFSDVVMPGGMSGFDLARKARNLRPDLGVLLTSGYVGDETAVWENEFPLIDKPFERPALAAKIRALLETSAPVERSAAGK